MKNPEDFIIWPFPIHNGERTEASKMLILKSRSLEGSFKLDLESALYYKQPIDTNQEQEALF